METDGLVAHLKNCAPATPPLIFDATTKVCNYEINVDVGINSHALSSILSHLLFSRNVTCQQMIPFVMWWGLNPNPEVSTVLSQLKA
jgi:hypothetical protein